MPRDKGKKMSNEAEPKTRTSIIRKRIQRTLKTAEYESLVIEDGFEEVIEWSSLSERQKKIDNWNTLLIQGFKQTGDRVLSELGITHKKAYFHNPNEETKQRYQKQAEASNTNESESETKRSALDLDDLDTLGT